MSGAPAVDSFAGRELIFSVSPSSSSTNVRGSRDTKSLAAALSWRVAVISCSPALIVRRMVFNGGDGASGSAAYKNGNILFMAYMCLMKLCRLD